MKSGVHRPLPCSHKVLRQMVYRADPISMFDDQAYLKNLVQEQLTALDVARKKD